MVSNRPPCQTTAPGWKRRNCSASRSSWASASGVRGQQHLEPTIEVEPVNNIGADAPPDVVGCFDDHDIAPGRVEHSGGRQTGKPGTDDHDLGVLG